MANAANAMRRDERYRHVIAWSFDDGETIDYLLDIPVSVEITYSDPSEGVSIATLMIDGIRVIKTSQYCWVLSREMKDGKRMCVHVFGISEPTWQERGLKLLKAGLK